MTDVLINILALILALGIIVFIHELGHLLVAKLFDTRVKTFSLGFGTRLWGFQRGETDYRVSLIPLGGYVALGGENPEESTGDPREFLSKPRWQRILVYIAGPAMNAVLSVGLVAGIFMAGTTLTDPSDLEPVIGEVEPGSSAAAAGLLPGDRIVAVAGEATTSWQDIILELVSSPDRPVELTVERNGQQLAATVTPAKLSKYETGDLAGLFPRAFPSLEEVTDGSPAAQAGLRAGDVVRSIDGRTLLGITELVEHIRARPGQPIDLQVKRLDEVLRVTVTPEDNGGTGQIGVRLGYTGEYKKYGPVRAVVESARYNWNLVRQIGELVGKLASGRLSARGSLAGPIEIAAQSGDAARRGAADLIHFIAFISINIGLLNLMPIPILDGGQILILLIESTMRRDLPLRAKEIISQVGFVLILLLMLMVIWFDVSRRLLPG